MKWIKQYDSLIIKMNVFIYRILAYVRVPT